MSNSALNTQVGGDHYAKLKIQPVEYIYKNSIGYFEGNIIKYVTRWKFKNGIEDLKKAKHYIELLLEMENQNIKMIQENPEDLHPDIKEIWKHAGRLKIQIPPRYLQLMKKNIVDKSLIEFLNSLRRTK